VTKQRINDIKKMIANEIRVFGVRWGTENFECTKEVAMERAAYLSGSISIWMMMANDDKDSDLLLDLSSAVTEVLKRFDGPTVDVQDTHNDF